MMLALAIIRFVIVAIACIVVAGLGISTYLTWRETIRTLEKITQECKKITAKAEELLEYLKKQ